MSRRILRAATAGALILGLGLVSTPPAMASDEPALAGVAPIPGPQEALVPALAAAQAALWQSSTVSLIAGQTRHLSVEGTQADRTLLGAWHVSGLPQGRSTYTRVILRKSGNSFYAAQLRNTTGGVARLEIQRVRNGAITVLAAKDLGRDTPTTQSNVLFGIKGSTLTASSWRTGQTRPAAAQLTVQDTAFTSGSAGVSGYLQSGTTGTVTQTFSSVTDDAPGTPEPGQPEPPAEGNVAGWGTPTWRDEFTGDLSKWRVMNNSFLSYDWAKVLASNATVSGGFLTLHTRREATAQTVNGNLRGYSSAYLDTVGKQSQAYGRWEVRAKLPTVKGKSKGIWPAFWLRPNDGGHGEIDILEAYGTPNTKGINTGTRTEVTTHFAPAGTANYKIGQWTPENIDVNDGAFHTWAVEWTPSRITYLVDGQAFFTVTPQSDSRFAKVFGSGRAFNMRLNVQVGSSYWGAPNSTETVDHSQFVVDYVRVWKYSG